MFYQKDTCVFIKRHESFNEKTRVFLSVLKTTYSSGLQKDIFMA